MDTMHGRLAITLACINCIHYIMITALGHYGQEGLNATVLPTHTNIENKNSIIEWFNIYMGCTQGLSPTAWWFD